MKDTRRKLVCAGLLAAATAQAQQPDAAEHSRALEALRDYAINYTMRLPDFICSQVVERAFGKNGRGGRDAIVEQVTYVNGREHYSVTKINGQPVAKGRDQIADILSTGEFGSLMASTLSPETGADVLWEHAMTQNGQKVNVFSYRVPEQKGYGLVESTGTQQVPYKGLIYADAQTGAVMRIELECEVPQDSDYRVLEIALDYKPTELGGREFLLPAHYHLHAIRESARADRKLPRSERRLIEQTNEAHYKGYRKFDADSRVTFGNEALPRR